MTKNFKFLKNSTIISLTDLNRIKKFLCTSLSQQNIYPKKIISRNKTESLIKRMKSYDELKINNKKRICADDDINNKIKEKANKYYEENLDEVKQMNKLVLCAKVANIRDKQIEAQEKMKLLEKKRKEKLDLLFEIERLKELKNREIQEIKIKNKKKEGGEIIKEQIKYNEKKKEIEKEMIKKEHEEILSLQKKLEEENEKKYLMNKKKGQKLIKEILEENKAFVEKKKLQKLKEIEEEKKMLEYNKKKMEEDEKKIKKMKEERKQKEIEIMKIRESQKKVNDYKLFLDDLILRRSYESSERRERKKEKENIIKKKKMWEDLIKQNNNLIKLKTLEKLENYGKEKNEFFTITSKLEKEMEMDNKLKIKYKNRLNMHNYELLKLIKQKEEDKKLKKREILEEGRIIKQNNEKHINKIELIKRKKIKELESLNINPNYLVPLKHFKTSSK